MSLLPASSSRLMHVLAETLDDRLTAIPVPGPEVVRPETAPESIVPFLAWGWSVDLWDMDWPIETKRQITADALEMHRLKGTEAGIRRYLAYTAAKDVSMTLPPQDFFLSAGPEDDPKWRTWLDSLPEVRLYQVQSRIVSPFGVWSLGNENTLPDSAFLADGEGLFQLAPLRSVYDDDDADDLTEIEYATLVVGSTETKIAMRRRADTRVGRVGDVVEYRLPGWAGSGVFADDALLNGPDYLNGVAATPEWLRIALGPAVASGSGWPLADELVSSVQDVNPEVGVYEVVSEIGLLASADYCDDAILDLETAGSGIYQSIRLIRPGLTLPPAASFWDDGRLSMSAYQAEVMLALPEFVGVSVMYANSAYVGEMVCSPVDDLADLEFAMDAIEAAQAVRDHMFVDLNIPNAKSLQSARQLSALSLR